LGNHCSARDIKHAYMTKLSIMDHLNINKTLGSDEAIKKIKQAYKCLADHDLRTCYDKKRKEENDHFDSCCMDISLYLAAFGLIAAYYNFQGFPYSLKMYHGYKVPMMTSEYGVEFYIRSATYFDMLYLFGTRARLDIMVRGSPGVRLVSKINTTTDYYKILGLGNHCSARDIKHAYMTKLSIMDHLNINKTPGSDEAIKKIEQAYKCLADHDLRTCYDKKRKEENDHFDSCCMYISLYLAAFGLIAAYYNFQGFPYSLKMYHG
nr:hypothetical protein [Tanacetum cinerariifolium]